jgi:hypothetical protein
MEHGLEQKKRELLGIRVFQFLRDPRLFQLAPSMLIG